MRAKRIALVAGVSMGLVLYDADTARIDAGPRYNRAVRGV